MSEANAGDVMTVGSRTLVHRAAGMSAGAARRVDGRAMWMVGLKKRVFS